MKERLHDGLLVLVLVPVLVHELVLLPAEEAAASESEAKDFRCSVAGMLSEQYLHGQRYVESSEA